MFCLRSWLPLLFIPTNASPAFILLFFICTYFLNRPCFYCSFLLLILFLTSCNWSDRCFFDLSANWFQSRTSPVEPGTGDLSDEIKAAISVAAHVVNTTAEAVATATAEHIAKERAEWTGLGMEWLRSLLGKREWRIECLDVYVRL
ncbi:hypothetical protein PpBr36_00889 [Pyricularia pennisetigena]|uniref:hypothetical protein n=1 Tax=Pyricularia pennisetigena TaxID=1578925 RepID=UPI00114DB45C|nr:hypothetical protein PpBr36_00889 [Pyricularia pennisetigena]TLS29044.1 hypothetical protein PpBr36_00889 [Pyricularia pennisetigena]